MIINVDPTGPLPPPDGNGRVVLHAIAGNFILTGCATFLLSAASLVSLLYWLNYFETGHFPALASQDLALTLKFGFLAISGLPFLFAELLSPPCVTITNSGVSLRHRGSTKAVFWTKLTEINLQERTSRNRYGDLTGRTYCRVTGHGERLMLAPVFGVSPAGLAAYLQARAQSQTGGSIAVTQTPRLTMTPLAKLQLLLLGIMGTFALAAMLLTYGVVRNNQSAIYIAQHLPH
jgi:hypothetical protein